ncbi:MAG: Asp-tRNA(Asn)/Glu-tRNA(Gln) amidotransferase subunit GatB [Simkania sp.]|nr:Asp-tRNA(Asn)/Glu-tRNA(Gln) amidotransferase subunit GatB [Simkania sp.]
MNNSTWEPVIGLEIHVQLKTRSKLFSTAPNRFGDEPNINIGVVCTGQPGSLPVLNKEAVKKAVQFGCAIGAKVEKFSKFDRKSYFYPDSPRNFQITQYDQPIIIGGSVQAVVNGEIKNFSVHRAHIEDDSGMLKHFTGFAGVDYNRAGVPLIEVVSEPCMHSPKDAVAYATAIKSIMEYLDASDCNMDEGSLRFDCNISVRKRGETKLRNKIEIKNMNSFHNMEMALEAEIARQIAIYEKDPHAEIIKGTFRFDLEKKETVMMRLKEEADDYRYFPEPDLPPLVLSDEYIEAIRNSLPELPLQRLHRYMETLHLSDYAANLLILDKELCHYFEEGLAHCSNARNLCNWITVEFVGRLKEQGKTPMSAGIAARHIAELVELIEKGTITGKIAKLVADDMVATIGTSPTEIVQKNPDYQPVSDQGTIEALVDAVLESNPQSIADFKSGKTKAYAFLIGQIMKLCKGKADPAVVNKILTQKLQ